MELSFLSTPIDLPTGPKFALRGKIATMDDQFRVLIGGVIYIDKGVIIAVSPGSAAPPPGFESTPVVETYGTIFPGLIELHNHLSYNALPLWNVPKKYTNRSQWGGHPDYRKLISGPMTVLGRTPGYVEAIVRYVECKCLLGGVTTSQGIALFSNNGIQKYYRGVIRNVEETGDKALPDATSKIGDVDAADAQKFFARLKTSSCMLLHLSEGIDDAAQSHFLALHLPDGDWALTDNFAGIHSAGLKAQDFQVLQQHGGAMIWSPFSNLLLYGQTADIRAAKQAGVLMGIGSDWSPSGSKNLLGELKVASVASQLAGGLFTDRELAAMATRNAAKILGWEKALGSLEAGKKADLIVINGRRGDPYRRLIRTREDALMLVVINGIPRYGASRLMNVFGLETETVKVGGLRRKLNLAQESGDAIVGSLSLADARTRLADGLQRLAELALDLESFGPSMMPIGPEAGHESWFLLLENNEMSGDSVRTHLPDAETGELTGMIEFAPAIPLSQLLEPVVLDGLTAIDDPAFQASIARQGNLPAAIKQGLMELLV